MILQNTTLKDLECTSYAQYFLNGKGHVPSEQFILGAIISNNAKINNAFRGIRTKDYKLAYVKKKQTGEYVLYDL